METNIKLGCGFLNYLDPLEPLNCFLNNRDDCLNWSQCAVLTQRNHADTAKLNQFTFEGNLISLTILYCWNEIGVEWIYVMFTSFWRKIEKRFLCTKCFFLSYITFAQQLSIATIGLGLCCLHNCLY